MGTKNIIGLSILLSFLLIGLGIFFNFIKIDFHFSFATFILAILGIGAFLLSAGAVLPKDGRSGLTTIMISSTLLILSALSTISISIA